MTTFRRPEPFTKNGVTRAIPAELGETEGGQVRCRICVRGCLLNHEQVGFCSAVVHWNHRLYSLAYGVVAELNVSPIEERLFHTIVGAPMLSIGGVGCNLRCLFCLNWDIAFRDASRGNGLDTPNLAPEDAVDLAIRNGCEGIDWSHNEATISPAYVRDVADQAKQRGLLTCLVTNGLMSDATLDFLGPYIDGYRVDVKSLDSAFYRQLAHLPGPVDPLRSAHRAQQDYGMRVEVFTNLMPGYSDADDHIRRIADRILDDLGQETPWHLTSYVPYAHMKHVPPTPPATLERARNIARERGLWYVYTDSLTDPSAANTYCPACSALLVERLPNGVRISDVLLDGACSKCGQAINITISQSISRREGLGA
ncbi:MAG TPA: AmmeMemoRadiSam system radical SAM enzyme [Ktedonobacterales bacterium]